MREPRAVHSGMLVLRQCAERRTYQRLPKSPSILVITLFNLILHARLHPHEGGDECTKKGTSSECSLNERATNEQCTQPPTARSVLYVLLACFHVARRATSGSGFLFACHVCEWIARRGSGTAVSYLKHEQPAASNCKRSTFSFRGRGFFRVFARKGGYGGGQTPT